MPTKVRLTANFERNLDSIREFLDHADAGSSFDDLIETLFDRLIPNLQRFPQIGRNFLEMIPQSQEGRARHERLAKLAGPQAELREYISGDYLVLYLLSKPGIHLLAIAHHRQLSFDLSQHWS